MIVWKKNLIFTISICLANKFDFYFFELQEKYLKIIILKKYNSTMGPTFENCCNKFVKVNNVTIRQGVHFPIFRNIGQFLKFRLNTKIDNYHEKTKTTQH